MEKFTWGGGQAVSVNLKEQDVYLCPAFGTERKNGKRCMMERVITLVDKLAKSHMLSREEFSFLLDNIGEEDTYLYGKAREAALANYGNKIYVRGLMEFTNYCKNDCYYCGIRRSNQKASRYRAGSTRGGDMRV